MGTPRPQGPEEMALAPGAMPPSEDADLGGVVRSTLIEEGRAIVASNVASLGDLPNLRLLWLGEKATLHGARAPCSGPTSIAQREGPDLFWTTRRRFTCGRV
jgi:hypothetical protein